MVPLLLSPESRGTKQQVKEKTKRNISIRNFRIIGVILSKDIVNWKR